MKIKQIVAKAKLTKSSGNLYIIDMTETLGRKLHIPAYTAKEARENAEQFLIDETVKPEGT